MPGRTTRRGDRQTFLIAHEPGRARLRELAREPRANRPERTLFTLRLPVLLLVQTGDARLRFRVRDARAVCPRRARFELTRGTVVSGRARPRTLRCRAPGLAHEPREARLRRREVVRDRSIRRDPGAAIRPERTRKRPFRGAKICKVRRPRAFEAVVTGRAHLAHASEAGDVAHRAARAHVRDRRADVRRDEPDRRREAARLSGARLERADGAEREVARGAAAAGAERPARALDHLPVRAVRPRGTRREVEQRALRRVVAAVVGHLDEHRARAGGLLGCDAHYRERRQEEGSHDLFPHLARQRRAVDETAAGDEHRGSPAGDARTRRHRGDA
eukprot:30087-Pelagococcus_subviridis.AAC.5